jgi:hypothetical protein
MSLTAPVSQDNFHFSNGDLFVEASGANRHRRATVSELRDLFHPPQNSSVPVRDPPAHWYEAQLIHYGLPSSKVKGTAVKRLLDAVNSGGLAVPQAIVNVEKSLKKQWDANEKKAKKEAAKGSTTHGAKSQGTKRKAEEIQDRHSVGVSGVNFNFTLNMGSIGMHTVEPASALPPIARKAKTGTKAPRREKQGPSRKASALPTSKREQIPHGGPARSELGTTVRSKARKEPKAKAEPKVKPEPKAKTEPRIKKERLAPSTPRKIKAEPSIRDNGAPPSPSPSTISLGLINGFYVVTCPYVTGQWGCQDLNIIVCFDTQHVWCAYDFEAFTGIFLLDRRPVQASAEQIPVRWRGRETGEGEMTTGNNNHGWISFLGGGRIEGCLEIMGDFEFEGYKVEGGGPMRSARSMREEWESYNEEAYEYERVNRWG